MISAKTLRDRLQQIVDTVPPSMWVFSGKSNPGCIMQIALDTEDSLSFEYILNVSGTTSKKLRRITAAADALHNVGRRGVPLSAWVFNGYDTEDGDRKRLHFNIVRELDAAIASL